MNFPDIADLPVNPELPDPLEMFGGSPVATPQQWRDERRPELIALFQHYMYGYAPPGPGLDTLRPRIEDTDPGFFDGKATKKEIALNLADGAEGPQMQLLLVVPNDRSGPAPVFVGPNFRGNHALVEGPGVQLTRAWMRGEPPETVDGRATDAARGTQVDHWNLEYAIDRGYGVATFYYGDVDPDRAAPPYFDDGIHPHYFRPGQTEPGPHDWGAIAAWAWGISRAVDYLLTDADIDAARIASVGHSRNGKAALLAAAFDERIALAVANQAGCGGSSPSRSDVGESVRQINETFPHWFNDVFPRFNDQVERLPFDQHSLIALMAPRPVLLTAAVEDQWADPAGMFRALQAADPVYRFLGAPGLDAAQLPEPGNLVDSRLGYFIRPGTHGMRQIDWTAYLDFADRHWPT